MESIRLLLVCASLLACARASTRDIIEGLSFVDHSSAEDPDELDESEMRRVAELLAQEPLSPDQQARLLHNYQKATPEMQALIKTSVEMEGMDPLLRCAACDAALGELQMSMSQHLKEAAKVEPGKPHWAILWTVMEISEKVSLVQDLYTGELCSERLEVYGLHMPTKSYVPIQLGLPHTNTESDVKASLINQCKFLRYAFSLKIATGLGNDTARIHRQIIAHDGSVEDELLGLWHAVRKGVCNAVTRAEGACFMQNHPMMQQNQHQHIEL